MAFVHCHSCPWSQGDFWGKSYNPISFFLRYDLGYIMPRFIGGDPEFVQHTPFTLRFGLTKKTLELDTPNEKEVVNPYRPLRTITHNYVFSWLVLWRAITKWLRRMRTQVWSNASWKKAIAANGGKWPVCPACGANDLDID